MKPKKWMILSATVLVLFLAFLYLPIPGLESAGHRSLRWQADGDAAEIAGERAESHFRRLLAKSNLKRPFPDMPIRKDNLTTPEKIELGRLLFFDPVLSDDNEISCAHCHHPDLGLSDNRGRAMGNSADGVGPERTGGVLLRRGAPTLWNAAYNQRQFWDGRARDLEDQAGNPITDPNEMAQDTTQLVDELRGIPEYSRMFEKAFGARKGPAVTFQNVVYALAAFERTLLSTRSKFDRYANGEVSALSPIERRGLNVFRSLKTRCFECHNFPTFANPDFKVIGVPDLLDSEPDLGRGEIAGERYNRAFKVPTLRNVALTAPYMHNGIFETLDEVIDFYAGGGGPGKALNVSNLDDKIRKFSLTAEEKSSLIAFLHALTDESNKPEIPESVPSGLPVVPKLENQSPKLAAFKAEPAASRSLHIARARKRIIVMEGQLIQDGIDVAAPGDTIFVMPGTYHETLTVDVSGITLWGAGIKGERPVLDGQNRLSDGLIGSGSDFEMGNFIVKNYTANGVMMNGSVKVTFRHLFCENTGLYGIYPVECVNVLVEECSVTGASDAGIYVGQSKDIVVRSCKAYGNVSGIEIENSVNALVENNEVFDNAGGILVFLLPNNPSKISRNCKVVRNRVYRNNHENFGDPTAIVSRVPSGSGIIILAADDVEVTENDIRDNRSFGVSVLGLDLLFGAGTDYDVEPFPDQCWIHGNQMQNNGSEPAGLIEKLGFEGKDLLWDLSGSGNSWDQPDASRLPAWLPNKNWSGLRRRANWRLWQMLAKIAG